MIPDYQDEDYVMTVDELRKKLKGIRGDAKVYVVLDKSDDNWDYDNDCYREAHPVEMVEKEWIFDEYSDECNCILHLQDPFYENYKVQRK